VVERRKQTMKGLQLNKRNISMMVLLGLVLFSLHLLATPAAATPPSGLSAEPVASGVLPEAIRVKLKDGEGGFGAGTAVRNIVMVKYTLEPGGTFGWHEHGGPVWAVVKSGTLSIYDGDDPTCTPQVYAAGNGFLDPGDHVHLGINETSEPVEVYVTFMLPEGGLTRIDAADPGICQ
jgi:quercetin dioxygenase-like cupin family protein